jgi:hypothetical protein
MLNSWFDTATLFIQSQRVIGLRLMKMAWGGQGAQDEAFRMVGEKVEASMDSILMLIAGGSGNMVLAHYNELVADNVERLTADHSRFR